MKFLKYIPIAVLLTFISCNSAKKEKNDTKIVEDVLGRKVKVPKKVTKIIAINAGALRMLTYVATEMVIGVEQVEKKGISLYNFINPELKEKKLIGPRNGGDPELIIKANPDVVFCSFAKAADIEILQKKIGIPVIGLTNPEIAIKQEEWLKNITVIGEVVNKQNVAKNLTDFVEKNISELNERTKDGEKHTKPTVYVGGIAYNGNHGITSTRPFYSPFEFVNANNIAYDLVEKSSVVKYQAYIDSEQLLLWNPEIIFIDGRGFSLSMKDMTENVTLRKNLQAIKNDKIHLLYPYNAYSANYEIALVNSWYIGKVLYPEKFKDINFNDKLKEILNVFYRKNVDTTLFKNYFRPIDKTDFE